MVSADLNLVSPEPISRPPQPNTKPAVLLSRSADRNLRAPILAVDICRPLFKMRLQRINLTPPLPNPLLLWRRGLGRAGPFRARIASGGTDEMCPKSCC